MNRRNFFGGGVSGLFGLLFGHRKLKAGSSDDLMVGNPPVAQWREYRTALVRHIDDRCIFPETVDRSDRTVPWVVNFFRGAAPYIDGDYFPYALDSSRRIAIVRYSNRQDAERAATDWRSFLMTKDEVVRLSGGKK